MGSLFLNIGHNMQLETISQCHYAGFEIVDTSKEV